HRPRQPLGRILARGRRETPARGALASGIAMAERQRRKLTAILAADVAAYSRLVGADEEGTLRRLRAVRGEVIEPEIAANHGRLFHTAGDSILIEFASVVDATRC